LWPFSGDVCTWGTLTPNQIASAGTAQYSSRPTCGDAVSNSPKITVPPPPAALAQVLFPLTPEQFAEAYALGSAFPFIDDSKTRFEWFDDANDLGWRLWLFDLAGESINATVDGERLPIERVLLEDAPLRGSLQAYGRAAANRLLCLAPAHQKKGLAKEIYKREEPLFRQWSARELQLDAGCEALKAGTWIRAGFRPGTGHQLAWERDWQEYQTKELGRREGQFVQFPLSWAEWPSEFYKKLATRLMVMPMFLEL